MKQQFFGLWVIGLSGLAGCSSSPVEEGGSTTGIAGAGRLLSPQLEIVGGPSGSTNGKVLLRDQGPQGIELVVVDFGEDTLAMAVGGPITTSPSFTDGGTIAEIHHALHPEEATLSESVVALSDRFAALQKATIPASTVEQKDDSAITVKSLTTFKSTVCKSFTETDYRWDPNQCVFQSDSGGLFQTASAFAFSGERTYGWNNNAHTAVLEWYGRCSPNVGCVPSVYYSTTLPNYWWTWLSVVRGAFPYSFGVDLDTRDYSSPKELGLTEHRAVALVH